VVLRRADPGVICIGQPAHAWVSGQLARAWAEPFDPREEVCLAAAQHDLGMAEWDAAPTLNPDTGFPHSFLEMPLETHLRLWGRAPALALSQSRWAGLLVSMHGAALYTRRRGEPGVAEFLDAQAALQARLRESLGISEADARGPQRLLAAWDWMSLVLCMDRLPATVEGPELEMRDGGGGTVAVDPWPFAAPALDVQVDGRHLPEPSSDEEAMRATLEAAEWVRLDFRLRPGAANR
jgi:hypothetical protein